MKKKILAMLLASAMLLSFAGCSEGGDSQGGGNDSDNQGGGNSDGDNNGDSNAEDVELSDDGDKLTIVTWESNSDVTNMVRIFCENTGVSEDQVEIVRQGKDGTEGSTQIQQYLKGDGDADIITLEADWILKYINDASLTAPLSAVGISESDLSNPYSYTVAIGKNENGVLMGASFQAAPGGFLYRADLAEQYLDVHSPEEMQALISDWDKFQETAAKLYEASGEKTSLAATEGGLWQVYQANRTKPWVQDGKLVMDNAEEFYDIAKDFSDNHYLAGVSQWADPWYAAIQDGSALGDFVPTWGATATDGSILTNFSGEEGKSASYGNMAFCEGPSAYFWGGTWLGVSTKCDNKSLAKQFIEYFTCDADGMRKYSEETGDFCNNKTVMSALVDEGFNSNALLKDGQDQFAIFLPQADGIKMDGLITKYDATIKSAFNDSVNGYLNGTYSTKDDAIAGFKKEVAAAISDITVE